MDKEFFGLAAEEVSRGKIDQPLLVKAVSLSDGDEKRGEALYIQLRAGEIRQGRRSRPKLKPAPPEQPTDDGLSDLERGAKALKDVAWLLFLPVVAIVVLIVIAN